MPNNPGSSHKTALRLSVLATLCALAVAALAHPLGNFTINHFVRISPSVDRVQLRYIVDLAEIPTFQALKSADHNSDGALSQAELDGWLASAAPGFVAGLLLSAEDRGINLELVDKTVTLAPGAAELPTMRLVLALVGKIEGVNPAAQYRFENTNGIGRLGWYELVITPRDGVSVYDSTIFGNGVTDELKVYPQDQMMAPLNERGGRWSMSQGRMPEGAQPLKLRDGRAVASSRDRFAELIAVPNLSLGVGLLGLLVAFGLGGLHALSPGHGKTVVGAYLIGARGTPKHAVFLGLTVTVTHTSGVFALGLITLFASEYVLPEQLFPILSFVSGAIVLAIGLSLFTKRLRTLISSRAGAWGQGKVIETHIAHDHEHHDRGAGPHSHADSHSHLPPGADGAPITWRSLLALGVSGGLLPCPSALVVLLAAISLGRIGYGLLLIAAFSLGLAAVLTAVGFAFVYASQRVSISGKLGKLVEWLPVGSALVISIIGAVICYQAFDQGGVSAASLWQSSSAAVSAEPGAFSIVSILGAGLVIGLKHAIEADHLAAISTIVSERRSLLSSTLIGGLWGIGHTISLLSAGVIVILLQVKIPDRLAQGLEFCVAIMLVGLGTNTLYKLIRGGRVHLHTHTHGGHEHSHPHLHPQSVETGPRSHHGSGPGFRPLVIGLVHGLAGSAALMLLVLTTISSPAIAFAYIAVFGLGSIGGMMLMSSLIALPAALAANRFAAANVAIRTIAGCFSLGFGLFMAWEIGYVDGLLR